MPEILKVNDQISEEIVLTKAAEIVAGGGVIAYPTETFYGLGVDATNEKAIQKIFAVKGRNFRNPISLIIGQTDDIYSLVQDVPQAVKKLMATFWPGALTIIFKASDGVLPVLTAGTGKIGVRVSGSNAAQAIAQKLGHPLTATSANLSGKPECSRASEVAQQIGNKIDAIVDFGPTTGDKVSTIIDVTCDPPVILREGAISRQAIEKNLGI
ncbi:MAG: L-threonylcarbamoyladenylate synthase [Smithellaceae bacterium]|jgi:L-threonylcarbamoyladenylate synthase